ncbi:unnamed protein product [Cylindrotheca closterium]|uniref:PNPLA domain-containing protein n=1 Tax=Cylindrotheca closterium TaxID=2856 RepID=A0AAD2FU48_9STRA|nr:unnamed protein product [Cylindrotheca closterium]
MSSHTQNDPFVEALHDAIDRAAAILVSNYPVFKLVVSEAMETVFATKAVARQLALAVALETGMVTANQIFHVFNMILSHFSSKSRLIRHLSEQQTHAVTQDEWMDLAERIDHIQGDDIWRSDPECQLYERERISARIDEFVHLMRRRDIFEMMFELRGGIGRNRFGLLHEGLFSKAMAGSKVLVETYHNVVCAALDFVCDVPVPIGEPPIPTDARLAFFNETRHSYGRTALLLSGGAALGFYHVGVVKTLMQNRLMPRVLGGSSAGSIVCAMVGTRTDEECERDLFQLKGTESPGHSGKLTINFFRPLHIPLKNNSKKVGATPMQEAYNNSAGFFHDVKKTWQILCPIPVRRITSVIFDLLTLKTRPQELLMSDSEHFRLALRTNIGDFTFQEAFDRTGRILNITVTPNNSSDPPRLLNYLTAPHCLVWSAAVASSSLPGVFEANRLMVKDADGTVRYESAESAVFSDGSMEQDLPMQQLSEMFNVNHFIISQANPHALIFSSYAHLRRIWSNPISGFVNAVLSFLKDRCRSWLAHIVELVGARTFAPQHATSRGIMAQFFVQEYEGRNCDISLIPWLNHRSLFSALMHCLYNPTEEEFTDWVSAAERETWKHLPAIKSHIAEEITLDLCVQRLRKRLLAESWGKRRNHSTGQKMGDRVPSFFTSPSLINLGGLAVSDQSNIESIERTQGSGVSAASEDPNALQNVEINQGWAGMGLRGNRSCSSLERSPSAASGLFIEADGPLNIDSSYRMFADPEVTPTPTSPMEPDRNGYIKTTSMAQFYYRNSSSYTQLSRARSEDQVANLRVGEKARRKSKSMHSFRPDEQ